MGVGSSHSDICVLVEHAGEPLRLVVDEAGPAWTLPSTTTVDDPEGARCGRPAG